MLQMWGTLVAARPVGWQEWYWYWYGQRDVTLTDQTRQAAGLLPALKAHRGSLCNEYLRRKTPKGIKQHSIFSLASSGESRLMCRVSVGSTSNPDKAAAIKAAEQLKQHFLCAIKIIIVVYDRMFWGEAIHRIGSSTSV
jgi:hypothetical protein